MADRRIQSLSQQLRCLQCCSDPDCTGLRECRVCVSGASAEEEPNELEEGTVMNMDYEKLSKVAETESSVVPCCVQHADTKEVLIIAYVNDEALAHSRETKVRRPHASRPASPLVLLEAPLSAASGPPRACPCGLARRAAPVRVRTDCDVLVDIAQRAVGEGADLRRPAGPRGDPRQLRAEYAPPLPAPMRCRNPP